DGRLTDRVSILLPRGEIERIRLIIRRLLSAGTELFVVSIDLLSRQVIAGSVFGISRRQNPDVVNDLAVFDLAIRRFDKTELVDPGEARQRRNQSDVGTFRGLDRTNSTVVRRVNVADLKPRALSRKTAGPKGRQSSLVSNFRQRVRLIHKLRQLR